jgi:hypothetical protein
MGLRNCNNIAAPAPFAPSDASDSIWDCPLLLAAADGLQARFSMAKETEDFP